MFFISKIIFALIYASIDISIIFRIFRRNITSISWLTFVTIYSVFFLRQKILCFSLAGAQYSRCTTTVHLAQCNWKLKKERKKKDRGKKIEEVERDKKMERPLRKFAIFQTNSRLFYTASKRILNFKTDATVKRDRIDVT